MACPANRIEFGGPKFVWFSALKNSALNCKATRSVSGVVFIKERSTVSSPAPRSVPLPRFPQVLAIGREKAAGLNHCVCFLVSTDPLNNGFTSGRSGFLVFPSPDRFAPIWGVNGKPLNNVVMPFSFQHLISLPSLPA